MLLPYEEIITVFLEVSMPSIVIQMVKLKYTCPGKALILHVVSNYLLFPHMRLFKQLKQAQDCSWLPGTEALLEFGLLDQNLLPLMLENKTKQKPTSDNNRQM